MDSQQADQNPGEKGSQNKGESSHYPSHRRTTEPDRAYSYSFTLTSSKPTRPPSGFTPLGNQKIGYQELPLLTIPGTFQDTTRIKGENNNSFNQRKKDSDSMIKKLLYLMKGVHKSQE
ncbi:hypothetical protein O181_047615 [Austropuccinia psidii MF-1]|uniref:Uncharacterized protein n=1 Tax=Austropuccinia psidii MF-1 TaxID=1389203 RepID=A0A9Q3DQI6_9BASI|nr:hypothetical protein [Austropuccinia psidii MF-1]